MIRVDKPEDACQPKEGGWMTFSRWMLALTLPLTSLGATAAERALDKEIELNATLEQAWSAWTTREGITSFFAPDAQVDARVGGPFHIYIDPLAEPGLKGADEMRFLAVQPQRMISFDWNAPPSLPEARQQRTLVIVRFNPIDAQHTKVTLHHVGWGDGGEWDKAYQYFDKAWSFVLQNLKKRFEEGPRDWTDWLKQLEASHQKSARPP
jgi:uncharacterized protein YndB with AHSA1/START domain